MMRVKAKGILLCLYTGGEYKDFYLFDLYTEITPNVQFSEFYKWHLVFVSQEDYYSESN